MKISWSSVVGAVAALVSVKLIGHFFGFGASLIALCVLLLGWLSVLIFYRWQLAKIRQQLSHLDEEGRAALLSHATPEIRKDLERMTAKRKNA